MAAGGLHISLSAEPIFNIAGLSFTNSMLTSLIASGLLILFAVAVRSSFKETNKPTGIQNFAEWIVEMLYNLVNSVAGTTKKTEQFFPFIASFFLFIVINNWIGLLPGVGTIGFMETHEEVIPETAPAEARTPFVPQVQAATLTDEVGQAESHDEIEAVPLNDEHDGVIESTVEDDHGTATEDSHAAEATFVPYFRAGTADLNMTIALALVSQAVAQWFGFAHLGLGYLKKFINFSSPIMFFVGILELIGEFTKIVSFAFRLFGNVFAGEVLLAVIAFLVPVIAPMPFYGLELFVGMIQGLVFAMLSLVFYNIATMGHDDEH